MKTILTTEHTEYTERAIANYELEITTDKCSLIRRNFWERQPWSPLAPPEAGKHLAGIYFNVAQARRLYHTLLLWNIGYMIRFAKEYPLLSILQQPVAKSQTGTTSVIVPQAVAQLIADIYRRIEKVPQPAAQIPSNQNELSPILPQLAAKLTDIEKISQLLPKGSVPHAEPPVGLFFYMVFAPFLFGVKLFKAYLPGLGFSRSMPKCGGFFIFGGNHA